MSKSLKYRTIAGIRVRIAENVFSRMKGLIGVTSLPPNEGLLIPKCNAIHTFFMKFAIDAIFLDSNDKIVKRVNNIKPWRFFIWGGIKAKKVIEVMHR